MTSREANAVRSELVIASSNRGKIAEFRALLAQLPVDVRGMDEVCAKPLHIVEDGATFEENARKKATAVANATLMMTLADDSGLEVELLDGKPGVHSARYAREGATDAENNAALIRALEAMSDAAPVSRAKPFGARFRCVLVLIDPFSANGEPFVVEGACEGSITNTPRGSGGFGYDPLFVVDGHGKTLAELNEDEKNAVSHRAAALARLVPRLEQILASRREAARRTAG